MLIKRWNKTRNCFVWDVRLIDENGKKRLYSTGHTSKKLAEDYARKKKDEIEEKKRFPERFPRNILFVDFADEYLDKHAENIRSTRNYKSTAKILKEHFSDKYLHEITRYDIESYQSKRLKEVSEYTVNKDLAILKGIFTKAISWELINKNPAKGVKLSKVQPRYRYLTVEEIKKLLKACRTGYLKSMIIIDLLTGLRKTELFRLKWKHVDLDMNTLKVEDGKGGKTRFVPINETVIDELFKLHLRKKGEYLFHDQTGKLFKDVKKSFHGALARAGLEDVRFHDLRRTFGTMCAMKNVPPKTLQNWMGHESIETTMEYYVVSPEDFEQEAIKRLDGIVDTSVDTSKKEGIGDSLQKVENTKADDGNRTRDLLITSELLCL